MMLSVADHTFGDHISRRRAAEEAKATVRGAQHEVGYGQILEHTNLPFREARLEEDRQGIDYVIAEDTPQAAYVDVKASMNSIRRYGRPTGGKAVRTDYGTITLHSPIKDPEFNDGFFISDRAAAAKAHELVRLLDEQTGTHLAYQSASA